MQFSYLRFKHPNILHTSDELSRSNFFLESITPKTSEIKKSVWPQQAGNMENEFCQGDISSQFRCDSVGCDSVVPTDFPCSQYARAELTFSWVDCESSSKVRKMLIADTRIAFLFASAFTVDSISKCVWYLLTCISHSV